MQPCNTKIQVTTMSHAAACRQLYVHLNCLEKKEEEENYFRLYVTRLYCCKFTANHGDESSHEAKIQKMIGINRRCRIDLQTVVPVVGILEQAVHGVQHFVRNIEKPVTTTSQSHSYNTNTICQIYPLIFF